jgi:hypothetical protein
VSDPLTSREYAYFSVSGPSTHEEVTAKLRLKPTDAWNAGDINPKNGRAYPSMLWRLRSGFDDTKPLSQHIDTLLLLLGTRLEELRSLALEHDLTIQCVGYYTPSGHGAHLNREVVRQAARLGCSFDFDFHYTEPPEV